MKEQKIFGLDVTKKEFINNNIKAVKDELKRMKKEGKDYQDFLSLAQQFYKLYLLIELDTGYRTKEYDRLLKRGRKGLGYSYP